MKQEFSSKSTSINKNKVPTVFKKIIWKSGSFNLDIGGGRYDTASEYLKSFGAENRIYDKFNRSEAENSFALNKTDYDTATISNVLNVIKEREIWMDLAELAFDHLKPGGKLYITVYEGDRSSVGRKSKKDCWQNNLLVNDYAPLILARLLMTGKLSRHCMFNKVLYFEKS